MHLIHYSIPKMVEHYQVVKYWKRENISRAASRVIDIYQHKLSHLGFREIWDRFKSQVVDSIQIDQNPAIIILKWNLFELAFRPPTNNQIPIIEGHMVIWRPRDPRFVVFTNYDFVNSEASNYLKESNNILAQEAASMDLEVIEDPFSLVFPSKHFATIRISPAALVDPRRG